MSLSFVLTPATHPEPSTRRKVLVTGAAGRIGSYFTEHAHGRYDLRLTDRSFAESPPGLRGWGEVVEGELSDLAFLKSVCAGVDTVINLAGNPDAGATWTELLDANIIGTYHVMVAARAAGCRRLIHASSIHAVSGYPAGVQVKTSEPVNPGDVYGVSKCFGEAMGRYLAEQEGMSVIALRIGAFQPREAARREENLRLLDSFVSRRDLHQLLVRCVDADDRLRFAIFHGLSNNQFRRLDISDARELVGYEPQDDFARENPVLRESGVISHILTHNQSDAGQASGIREELGEKSAG